MIEGTTRRLQQGVVGRVEIGQVVVLLPVRSNQLIAQAKIQCQLIAEFVVVLEIAHVPATFIINFREVVELIVAAYAEEKVGKVICLPMKGIARRGFGGTG